MAELEAALERGSAREHALAKQLDAYRLHVFGSIGSGVMAEDWDLVMIHRICGRADSPVHHDCINDWPH